MKAGRDPRVGPLFWRLETERHRWSFRVHFWLHPANVLRVNRQPRFTEVMIGRCVVLCHSRVGRRNRLTPAPDIPASPVLRVRLRVILWREAVDTPRRGFRRFPVVCPAVGTPHTAAHLRVLGLADVVELDSTGPRARVRHMLAEVRNECLDTSVPVVR